MAFSSMRETTGLEIQTKDIQYVIKNRPSSLEVTTRNREEVWKQNKSTQFSTLTCHKFDESSAVEIPAYQCSASGTNVKYTEIAVPSGR